MTARNYKELEAFYTWCESHKCNDRLRERSNRRGIGQECQYAKDSKARLECFVRFCEEFMNKNC